MLLLWYGLPRVNYAYIVVTYILCSLTISYVYLDVYDNYVGDHTMTIMIMLYYVSICLMLMSYVD